LKQLNNINFVQTDMINNLDIGQIMKRQLPHRQSGKTAEFALCWSIVHL